MTQKKHWTNRNSKQILVADAKRGKRELASHDWFSLNDWFSLVYFWLDDKVARESLSQSRNVEMQNQGKCKPRTFDTQMKIVL